MQADDTENESDTGPTLTACKGKSDMDSVNDTKDSLWDLKRAYFHNKDQGNLPKKKALKWVGKGKVGSPTREKG